MSRLSLAAALLIAPVAVAEHDKPVTPKEDELAVLADPKSPDHQTVLDRYDGKVLKIEGRVSYNSGATLNSGFPTAPAVPTANYFYITLPKKKPADAEVVLRDFQWTKDPAMKKTIDQVHKKANEDRTRRAEKKSVPNPGVLLTIYARLDGGKLVDAATDPKIGGVPYKPKEKEPARLKDGKK
jgi:hypothetical protein